MDTPFLYFEDVKEGDTLPGLAFPISIKTMALAVCGTRDLMPYHHHSEYAKSLGNRDMFVNTMFEQALFGRFVTDWLGPESDFRETSLQMVASICPGDTAVLEGVVAKSGREDGEARIVVELSASNALGLSARASATLAMPSRETGPVRPLARLEKPHFEEHPEMPDFAREWLGQATPRTEGGYPVSEVQILYWCDMVEDANPLYTMGDYAQQSRHGGVIAPPMALITWMSGRGGHSGVDPQAPDVDVPERAPWPARSGEASRGTRFTPPGTTDTIASRSIQRYGVPLRPGDRVFSSTEIVNCSPRKQTRLGPGYFQTQLNTYTNQREEVVGTNIFELLRYSAK
jgi:acyl dehydratase